MLDTIARTAQASLYYALLEATVPRDRVCPINVTAARTVQLARRSPQSAAGVITVKMERLSRHRVKGDTSALLDRVSKLFVPAVTSALSGRRLCRSALHHSTAPYLRLRTRQSVPSDITALTSGCASPWNALLAPGYHARVRFGATTVPLAAIARM